MSLSRMRSRLSAAVVALLGVTLVALAAAASGCGGSGQLPAIAAPSATSETIMVRVVSDQDWHFKMAYPDGWVNTRYVNPSPAGSNPLLYMVAYADPNGAENDGSYLDSVQMAIYQLDKPMQSGDLTPQVASHLAVNVILKGMATFSARQLKKVKVGDVPGWTVGYQYQAGKQTVDANSILVVRGDRAYWMTTQSGAYSWRLVAATLATCQRNFKLLPE